MAASLGQVLNSNNATRATCILAAASAANGQPTGAVGVPCYPSSQQLLIAADDGVNYSAKASREASIVIKGTGTGTVSGTFRLWGFCAALGGGGSGDWVPVGPGADATKGMLNSGNAIGEVKADVVLHSESFYLAGLFDRLYLEMTAVTGTTPSFEAWIVTGRTVSF